MTAERERIAEELEDIAGLAAAGRSSELNPDCVVALAARVRALPAEPAADDAAVRETAAAIGQIPGLCIIVEHTGNTAGNLTVRDAIADVLRASLRGAARRPGPAAPPREEARP